MVVLGISTSSETGSLAIARDGVILSTREWKKKSTHSDVVTIELSSALEEAKILLKDLTALAVDAGPGSFTGLRVGLNLIRSLAYAFDIPVQIVSSLEILGFQILRPGDSAVIARPAIQSYVYAASISRTERGVTVLAPAQSLDRTQLSEFQKTTQVASVVLPTVEPSASALLDLVAADDKKASFISWKAVRPLYIRSSEAEEKLRAGVLKPLP